jgi:MFS family permease
MVQGLSVGGEYGTSATYMSEVALPEARLLRVLSIRNADRRQLLASLVVLIVQLSLSDTELRAWGWRIRSSSGHLRGGRMFLRASLTETSSAETRSRKEAGSLREIFKHHTRAFLSLGFTAGGSLIFYTFTTYMQKYLVNTAHMNDRTANIVMTAVLFTYMILQPPFGAFSDRFGRKTSMLLFSGLATVCTVPLMYAIGDIKSPYAAYGLIILALAIVSFYTSISGLVKAEMFPPEVRAMSVGLAYALANAIFGGSAEYAALWFKDSGAESDFYWYVTFMCAVAFVASVVMPNPKIKGYLQGQGTET